jgi:hypothetical protein
VGWVLYSDQTAIRAGHGKVFIFSKLVAMVRWKKTDGYLFYKAHLGSC